MKSGGSSGIDPTQHSALSVRELWGDMPLEEVYRIRDEVFVAEQALTDDARTDPDDHRSFHYLAYLGEQPVGTGRLTLYGREAQVAWVAVRQQWRQHGIGKALMLSIIERARVESSTHVALNAQTHALHFYSALGFDIVGGEFFMSGIGHQVMIKRLD
ncbi:MAG: GNAT family N-acetyltransferase [Chloroflexota bacterium]|nr:GNAT family N-acetyltransferase [Chloroflexota bacterium]